MFYTLIRAFLVPQRVKNLPAKQETQMQPLGQEDPLEKEIAAHSGILAQRIPWIEEPGGLQSMGWQRVGHEWVTNTHIHPLTNIALQPIPPCPQPLTANILLFLWKWFSIQMYLSVCNHTWVNIGRKTRIEWLD